MAKPEVCIQCTAFNSKGFALLSREYNKDHILRIATSTSLSHFLREIQEHSIKEQTVRITIDVALSEGWYTHV